MEIRKIRTKDIILTTVGVITALSLIQALAKDTQANEYQIIRACVKDIPDKTPCQDTDQPIQGLPVAVWENGASGEATDIYYTDASGVVKIPRDSAAWSVTRPPEDYPFDWYASIGPSSYEFRDGETDYLFRKPRQ